MPKWLPIRRHIARSAAPWRIIIFFALLLVLWSPLALATHFIGWLWNRADIAATLSILTLYSCFIVHAWGWGLWVHNWPRPFATYGLVFSWRFLANALTMLGIGFGLVLLLFGVEVILGWADFRPKQIVFIAFEGFWVGLGVGLAEELLFRGWLLSELRVSLSQTHAILGSSLIFAIAHFIKPLPDIIQTSPQFIGLLLLGLILSQGRFIRRLGQLSLGIPLGIHAGLVWGYYIVDVGDLVIPSGTVPEWVTGIHGNPLSGILGIAILGSLALLYHLKLQTE